MSTISVIIPCYNAARWLRNTLASVLAQTMPPLEIIFVDDDSSDGSADIVAAEFPQVRLLRGKNGGPSYARNLGAAAARGEWLQFLDADDLLHPMKLAWQQPTLAHQPAAVAFCYSPWQDLLEQNGEWRGVNLYSTTLDPDPFVQTLDTFNHLSAGLIRRSWFERIGGFDEAKPLIEDVQLQLRLLLAGGTFAHIPTAEPVYSYRRWGQSLSRRDPSRFMAECWANLQLTERELKAQGQLTAPRRTLLARNALIVARYYAEHDPALFEVVASEMARLDPTFLPTAPRPLALTSRLLGYRRAERLSVVYRRAKAWLTEQR
jgi:glycosyltransferase involved in cell wall biosynthesis